MIEQLNFEKLGGLIPVVIQDAESLQVVMVGYMNKEALQKTLDTKRVTFWSRSRQQLWQKGETSGHYLEPLSFQIDCDNDALLIKVKTHGPVCHTGNHSCFGEQAQTISPATVLEKLERIIEDRKNADPQKSYTARLFAEGLSRIAQKVGEEAVETILAGMEHNNQRLTEEAADLLYHLLVLLHERNTALADVTRELQKRMK